MAGRRRPWGAAAAAASIAFALTVTAVPLSASAVHGVHSVDVPTPQEIAAAKRNEAAKQAEIAKIGGLLKQSQQEADSTSRDAQTKGELYNIAQQQLAAATQSAQQLSDQQKAAAQQAAASQKKAAGIIAQLARTGGGDLTLGLLAGSGKDTDHLLQRLGSMNRLSESSQAILAKAEFDQNTATSLAKQAAAAKAARAVRADEAQHALASAQASASAATAQVSVVEASQATMYAQLADLKGTTAALEQQAAEAALIARTSGAPSGGAGNAGGSGSGGSSAGGSHSGGSGGSGSGSGGSGSGSGGTQPPPAHVDPTPPAPSANQVATAIAFARAQIGKPYVLDGAGPNGWDCSGLTMQAYAAAHVYIGGHGSTRQYNYVRLVPRSSGILPGDLIFYSTPESLAQGVIDHVTLAIGNGRMIEAPSPGKNVRDYFIYTQDLLPYVGRPTG